MKTGLFDMSMEHYRSEHGINQSTLKLMAKSPAHLIYRVDHPEPSTPDQIIGTIFDTAVFNPSELETCCHVRPSHYGDGSKDGRKPWHNGATFCKEWNVAHRDKPIISQADMTAIMLMRDAVFNHPAAAAALKQGAGKSLFCEDAETGLQLKCRPDWISGNVMLDLKSCQDANPTGFQRSIAQFGYDVQSAFYIDMATTLGLGIEHFCFIACEKEAPYAVGVYELLPDSIADGRSKYRRYLARYLECIVKDLWPAYSPNVEYISLPQYARFAEQLAQQLEDKPALPALEIA